MSTPRAIFDKSTLFSAETYRKTHFSAGYSKFFALFVAEITKIMYPKIQPTSTSSSKDDFWAAIIGGFFFILFLIIACCC